MKSRVYFLLGAQNTSSSGYRVRQICGFFMAEREANTTPSREYARRLLAVLSAWPPSSKKGDIKSSSRSLAMQAHAGTSSISSPIVTAFAGKATTTSFDVAAFFEKRHDHVLRTIDKVLRGSPESAKPNFGVCYENNTLQNGKPQKYYRLTRDGFTFVTMGFTGEKATRFKWAYIEAFNRMEAQLKGIVLPSPLITPAQQLAVRNAIAKRAKDSSVAYQTIYHALYTRFQIAKYDQLKSSDFDTALKFISTCEVVPQLQKPDIPSESVVLNKDEVNQILGFIYNWRYLFRKDIERIYDLMVLLQSPLAPHFWEAIHDLGLPLLEDNLRRQGYDVKDLPCYKHLMGLS